MKSVFKVDDYLRKTSLTGPEIFMVVFSHKKEEDSVKKNLVIVEKISRFKRGLTTESANSQISQNRARLCTLKIALKFLHFILAQSGNSIIATACPLKSS